MNLSAVISVLGILLVLGFVFVKVERARKEKSILNYYLKPGFFGGLLGVVAIIIRSTFSFILLTLTGGSEEGRSVSFDMLINAIHIDHMLIAIIVGAFLGIFVAIALHNQVPGTKRG